MQAVSQVKNVGIPEVSNFTRSTYNAGTQNWNIDQAQNGTLYFANNSGLLQFDGSSWRIHYLPDKRAIRSVKVAADKKIYIGGYSEFGFFEANKSGSLRFSSLADLVEQKDRRKFEFIWKIHIVNGTIIFQSFERLFIYNGKTITVVDAPKRFQFSFTVDNRLFVQDKSKGIVELIGNRLVQIPGSTELNTTEIWGMCRMGTDRILISTLDKGIYVYEQGKFSQWNTEASSFVKKNSSLGSSVIMNEFIVLNSVLDGVAICNSAGKIVQHINRKKGLQNNTVLSSFVDQKNNLWLGLDNGIAFIKENSPFTYFNFSYDISTVYASAIHRGKLYVATNQGLYVHSWNTPFEEQSFTLVEGTIGQAWNIQIIDDQLFCSHNRGLLLVEAKKALKVLDVAGYWGVKRIPGRPDHIIGSNYNGFAVFRKTSSGWNFVNQIEGIQSSSSMFEIDYQTVWLKKDELLYRLIINDDLKRFSSTVIYKNLAPTTRGITSIQKLDEKVYFQSNNVFYRFSTEQDLFFKDQKMTNIFRGLPPARNIMQDSVGNIWYIFNESLGLLRRNPDGSYKNIIYPFSSLTGNLVSDYLSVTTVNKNNIFIGLTNGLAHYDGEHISNFATKPDVYFRSFTYAGSSLRLGDGLELTADITIPFLSNNIKFTYASPTYENLENLQFSYLLNGFDERWSHWTPLTMKEYTNLPEGDYKMLVKVRNSYGVQSDPAQIAFTISPPWYRHWLAICFYVVAAIGTLLIIRRRTQIKIRKTKYYQTIEQRKIYLEKEAKIRQEQFELEKEIERLKNERLQIKILSKDKELVNNSLQVVKKNKILNGIIQRLKEIDVESLDENTKFQFSKLNKSIVKEVNADKSWKDLEKHIRNVHFDFLKRLKEAHPTISPRELDLSTYLLMNMSTKEIAEIMNISGGGVELARYRLRKKLNLTKKENLTGFLMSI
jgi:ligand-binding sensor domain-containing protein/DNA-binding CsgD family transcriptional regulator